jgi:hypothetical protein
MTTVERLDAKVVSGASKDRCGPSNQQWNSVGDYVASQTATATLTATGARIPGGLVKNPDRLKHLVSRSQCPDQVRWSRISRVFLPAWTSSKVTSNPFWNERVLNNRRHLASSIEPYLSEGLAVTQRHREHDDGRGRFKLLIPSKKRCYIVFAPDYYLRCPQPSSNPGAKVTKAAEPFGDAFKRHAHLSRLLQWQIEITCNYFGVETPRTSFGGNSSLKS